MSLKLWLHPSPCPRIAGGLGRMSVTGALKKQERGHLAPDHGETINTSLCYGFTRSVFDSAVSISATVTVRGTPKVCPHFTTNKRSTSLNNQYSVGRRCFLYRDVLISLWLFLVMVCFNMVIFWNGCVWVCFCFVPHYWILTRNFERLDILEKILW